MSRRSLNYDVFISYNSQDANLVKLLAVLLKQQGLTYWLDEERLTAGDSWRDPIEIAMHQSRTVVIAWGREGLGPIQREERDLAYDIRRLDPDFRLVYVVLPGAKIPQGTWLNIDINVAFSRSFDEPHAFQKLLHGLTGEAPPDPLAACLPDTPSPYLGLAPFGEGNEEYFLGREQEALAMVDALGQHPFLAIVGDAGSGKTSLVQAGLLAHLLRLHSGSRWRAQVLRPEREPLLNLARALSRAMDPGKANPFELAGQIHEQLRQEASLPSILRTLLSPEQRVVLVIDRLEQILFIEDEEERRLFLRAIASVEKGGSPTLWIVVTLRREHEGLLEHDPDLKAQARGHRFDLGPLSEVGLQEAVERPVTLVGAIFDRGLAKVVRSVADVNGAISLPLLAFALKRLWDRREGRFLTLESYDPKEIFAAFASHSEQAVNQYSDSDREIARYLLMFLVWLDESTGRLAGRFLERSELLDRFQRRRRQAERVLDELQSQRLISTHFVDGDAVVGIIHESLIDHWPLLRQWFYLELPFLLWLQKTEERARDWREGGEKDANLLEGGRLEIAEEWLEKRHDLVTPSTEDFIYSSIRRKEVGEQTKTALVAVALITVFFFGALWLFARAQWTAALSRALAAEALELRAGPLDLALLLSLQAYETSRTVEARGSLLSLLGGTSHIRYILPRHERTVYAAAFSPDGKMVATGDLAKIYLWDSRTGSRLGAPLQDDGGEQIVSLAFHPGTPVLAASSEEAAQIHLWDLQNRRVLQTLKALPKIQNLTFSPDGRFLVASSEARILVFDLEASKLPQRLGPHGNWVSALAFSPLGVLATASYDGSIILREAGSWAEIRRLASKQSILDLAFSRDGSKLISVGTAVEVWDVASGVPLGKPCSQDTTEISSVSFAPNGDTFASAGIDGKILLWDSSDLSDCRPLASFGGHGASVWNIAFGPKGDLISSGEGGEVFVWNPQAEPRLSQVLGKQHSILQSVEISPDGKLLAASDRSGQIHLYVMNSGAHAGILPSRHKGAVNQVAFSPDGSLLASGGRDGWIRFWDVRSLQPQGELKPLYDGDAIRCLRFSPDGQWIAAGTKNGWVLVWSVKPGSSPLWHAKQHQGSVYAVAFDSQGVRLLSGGDDRSLILWEASRLKVLDRIPKAHSQSIASIASPRQGEVFATGGLDKTVRFWLVRDSLQPFGAPLSGGPLILGLAFSPDGSTLAAGGFWGEIALWDVPSGRLLGTGLRQRDRVASITFDRSGRYLLAGAGKQVFRWDLQYASWRLQACSVLRRDLTRDEWNRYMGARGYRKTCS